MSETGTETKEDIIYRLINSLGAANLETIDDEVGKLKAKTPELIGIEACRGGLKGILDRLVKKGRLQTKRVKHQLKNKYIYEIRYSCKEK